MLQDILFAITYYVNIYLLSYFLCVLLNISIIKILRNIQQSLNMSTELKTLAAPFTETLILG